MKCLFILLYTNIARLDIIKITTNNGLRKGFDKMRYLIITLLIVSLLMTILPANLAVASASNENGVEVDYSLIDTTGLTDNQKALLITAESFYLRRARAQYDMGTLASNAYCNLERRLVKQKAPEDYTSENVGYSDCSGFVYDVYWNALGMQIATPDKAWTGGYINLTDHIILKRSPATDPAAFDTPEKRENEKNEFLNTLEPGDIIVYRYAGDTGGHTMLYAGNDMMFHASGNSYKTADK